jgi:peptidoglycan/LPS O-acetylase OafA/YrhL
MRRPDRGNFDLIRLVAAGAVLFSHAFFLTGAITAAGGSTGRDPLEMVDGARSSLGSLAVDVFFVLSGYLVAQSWLADRRPAAYLARRALRIGPGLVATVLVTVLLVGPLLTSLPLGTYASAAATRSYLGNALLYHAQTTLPGVFQANVWHPDVNGSLWTLRYEFTWYLALPLLAATGVGMARRTVPVLLAIALTAVAMLPVGAAHSLPFELELGTILVLGSFALVGMGLYVYRDVVPMRGWIAALLMVIWVASWRTPLLNVSAVLAFGYSSIYLATRPAALRGRLVPRWDLSYGVYLYGFLAEQIAVAVLGRHASPATVLGLAVPLTAGSAMLSWKLVEAPGLRLKRHLRRRAQSEAEWHAVPASAEA